MITRKVDRDDHVAGFAYEWVRQLQSSLARQGGALTVICLEKGNTDGLEGVEIYSLGKEKKKGRISEAVAFQSVAARVVRKVDGVFCHMNPEYTIAVAPYALAFRKKIVSWYTHGNTSWKMRLMEKLADVVVTASPESFRIPSKKVVVTGHGIDVDYFQPMPLATRSHTDAFRMVSIGRISPTKDYESMIKAIDILRGRGMSDITLDVYGDPGLDDHRPYLEALVQMTSKMDIADRVKFRGPIPHRQTPEVYNQADVFLNMSGTGGLDKAVLEAMACGRVVICGNDAFRSLLSDEYSVSRNRPDLLADRIQWMHGLTADERASRGRALRDKVVASHSLDGLVQKIIELFKQTDNGVPG